MTLVERLLAPDWHDPTCPFKTHCYCDDGAPHDRVTHPLATEAANVIEALEGALRDARSYVAHDALSGDLRTVERSLADLNKIDAALALTNHISGSVEK